MSTVKSTESHPVGSSVEFDDPSDPDDSPRRLVGVVVAHRRDHKAKPPLDLVVVEFSPKPGQPKARVEGEPSIFNVMESPMRPRTHETKGSQRKTIALSDRIFWVKLADIKIPEEQVRKVRKDETHEALKRALALSPMGQDIPVPVDGLESLVLVDGANRVMAMRDLGWTDVLVRVDETARGSVGARFFASLVANTTSRPMLWCETAKAAKRVLDDKVVNPETRQPFTVAELAERIGMSGKSLINQIATVERLSAESLALCLAEPTRCAEAVWIDLVRLTAHDADLQARLETAVQRSITGGQRVTKVMMREYLHNMQDAGDRKQHRFFRKEVETTAAKVAALAEDTPHDAPQPALPVLPPPPGMEDAAPKVTAPSGLPVDPQGRPLTVGPAETPREPKRARRNARIGAVSVSVADTSAEGDVRVSVAFRFTYRAGLTPKQALSSALEAQLQEAFRTPGASDHKNHGAVSAWIDRLARAKVVAGKGKAPPRDRDAEPPVPEMDAPTDGAP